MATLDSTVIEKLRDSLSPSSIVVTRDSDIYQESIDRWSTSAVKPAALVVFPVSTKDVATAIRFSKSNSMDLAVKGGGHATSGASSTNGGLCIDLSKMRNVSVDPHAETITCGGGALWSDVDNAAYNHKLAIVGGTVSHTGVGGLTLGGGFGWLTAQYGLAVDNLLAVEMVLADGSIVNVSASENTDLFWAVRGAGAAFGVATSFTFRAHKQDEVWGGVMAFPTRLLPQVLDFANSLRGNSSLSKSSLMLGIERPPGLPTSVLAACFHNGPEDEAKKVFQPLTDLETRIAQIGMVPYPAMNDLPNPLAVPGERRSLKGTAFVTPVSPDFIQQMIKTFDEFMDSVPDAAHSGFVLEFYDLRKVLEIESTATAFPNRGACNVFIVGGWTQVEYDDVCRNWVRDVAAKFKDEFEKHRTEMLPEKAMSAVGSYINYDGIETGPTRASPREVFGENCDRLLTLKKKYDPHNIFNKSVDLVS